MTRYTTGRRTERRCLSIPVLLITMDRRIRMPLKKKLGCGSSLSHLVNWELYLNIARQSPYLVVRPPTLLCPHSHFPGLHFPDTLPKKVDATAFRGPTQSCYRIYSLWWVFTYTAFIVVSSLTALFTFFFTHYRNSQCLCWSTLRRPEMPCSQFGGHSSFVFNMGHSL